MSMGFLYTEVIRVLLGQWKTTLSQKGIEPLSLGFSVVNWICAPMEFMCWRNCWLCSACWMTKVSCTYLSHNLGGLGPVLMALVSNSSMIWLATRRHMRESMADHGPVQNTHHGKGNRYF